MHDPMTDTRARRAAAGPDVSVDGWHWWQTPWGTDIIRYWYAGPDEWSDGLDADMIATGWVYRGPVLPPAAIEARDAEIARLEAEVASLRLTLGGRTFSATAPEPIGCPAPGMCVQVAEIARLRDALAGLLADTQHSGHECGDGDCPVAAARAALAPPPASDGGEA